MSQILVIGQFDIHPDDAAAVAELMRAMMNETVRETGCQHYAFSRDLVRPARFQLSELWEDDAALAAHAKTAHMATYRAGLAQLRVQARWVKRYRVSDVNDL